MDPIDNSIVPNPLPQMSLQTYPPIACLPSETLTEIFERAVALNQTKSSSHDVQLRHLASVCRHWRAVAMAYPRLWTALVFTSVEITALMLQRSKECSLVVKVDCSSSSDSMQHVQQAVVLALSNLSRIRVLHIRVSPEFYDRVITAIVDRPAPALESFRLIWKHYRKDTVTLPLLFANVTPRLRHFAVRGVNVPWSLPLLHDLTHLEIRATVLIPSIAEFRDVLSHCPALESLVFKHTLLADSDHLQPPVSLPRLSSLHLTGPLSGCDALIHSICFPNTASITIWANYGSHSQLLHILTKFRDRVSTAARLCLTIKYSIIGVQAWTAAGLVSVEDPPLDVSFAGVLDAFFFRLLCGGLALTRLVRLEVEAFSLKRDIWEAMLSTLTNLQVLTMHDRRCFNLLPALMPMFGRATAFPALRELIIHAEGFFSSDIRDLRACLNLRRDNHAEIETVKLFGSMKLSKVDADMLRESVGDCVDWDGVEFLGEDVSGRE